MAPQTLHLQAVAGRVAASRHPRAQAVIYTGPCICLSRTEHNRTETAVPFTSQPESSDMHLTKSDAVSEEQKDGGRLRLPLCKKRTSSPPVWKSRNGKLPGRSCQMCACEYLSVWACAWMCVYGCVCFQGSWSLPMAEPWKRGFHPGLSLIREGSLIPSHPMLWFICILCQEVMEFCSAVCSENLEDVV